MSGWGPVLLSFQEGQCVSGIHNRKKGYWMFRIFDLEEGFFSTDLVKGVLKKIYI
jgi:hypothetical protein